MFCVCIANDIRNENFEQFEILETEKKHHYEKCESGNVYRQIPAMNHDHLGC